LSRSTPFGLLDLPADFAVLVGGGVDVDVIFAGHQVGGLCVGQHCRTLERAFRSAHERNDDAGIFTLRHRPVNMSGRGRPTEAGISHAPAELFRGDVEAEIGRAFALRGDGRILLRAIERRLHLTMSAKAGGGG
jgi:hypothetical protein